MMDVEVAQRRQFHSLQDEGDDVAGGPPLAQIAGQEQRRLAVEVNEACGQAG
jgi:hypothetical protein